MADRTTVLKSDPAKPPVDMVNPRKDSCPWCNFDNKDGKKDELYVHEKVTNVVRNVGHKWQCETCGKMWDLNQLGKTWSIELERGIAWLREQRIKSIQAENG